MENKKFIPAQRIIGSNKELFIIKYEGSVIEIHRTNNLYEPLVVQMNGVVLDTIPSKQKKEITFNIEDGSIHKLEVWNERINNSSLIKALGKDGIAIVIDGVPVQNSLADPLAGLSKPKLFLWLLAAFFFFLSIALPIIQIQNGYAIKLSMILFSYIFLFILSLYAVLTFQTNPIKSIWIGIVLIVLESLYSSYFIVSTVGFNIGSIGLLIVRLVLLSSLIFSLKTLKALLDINKVDRTEKELNEVSINNTRRSKIFTIKNSLIFSSVVVIVIGLYFGVGSLISYINKPSLERDNAIVFRTDLKLPELIPYRKGDKWGYVNSQGKIVIKPIYSKVEFFSENKFLQVEEDKLVGIIDDQGNILIPYLYKSINEIQNDSLFIIENKEGKYGVIDVNNNIIIPFVYQSLQKYPNLNLYLAQQDYLGIIDVQNNIVTPIMYDKEIEIGKYNAKISGLELCNSVIIARKKINEKLYSAIFNFDGSIVLDFVNAIITKGDHQLLNPVWMNGRHLEKDLLVFSVEKQNIYNPSSGQFEPERFNGIMDKTGNIILPPEYESISLYYSASKKYSTIGKFNYRTNRYVNGLINSKGEIVIPCENFEIEDYRVDNYDEYILIKNNSLYGVINSNNNVIFQPKYRDISIQRHNDDFFFAVTDNFNNKTGLLKNSSWRIYDEVIPFDYDWINVSPDNYNWIKVSNNNRVGAIDFNNNVIIPIEFLHMLNLSEGLVAVKYVEQDSIDFIINSNKVKTSYYLDQIHEGLAYGWADFDLVKRNPDYKYGNYTLIELSNALSDTSVRKKYYSENANYLTKFCKNYEDFVLRIVLGDWRSELPGKWGYFNEKGELTINFIYDDAKSFENGFARVKLNNKWGLINKNGEVVIPIKYTELEKVKDFDLFEVKKNNKTTGFVDLNGVEYFQN